MNRVRTTSRWILALGVAALLWPMAAWGATLNKPIKAVSFGTAQVGYIVGGLSDNRGVASWTQDGGQTWHAYNTAPNHFMIGVGASMDGGAATAVSSYEDILYRTSNLGLNWASSSVLGRSDIYSDVAYLAGGRRVAVGKSNANAALIALSLDGTTWSSSLEGPRYDDPNRPTVAWLTAVDAAPGGNVAWVVGNNNSLADPNFDWDKNDPNTFDSRIRDPKSYELIYKTTNAGSSWTTQTALMQTLDLTCVAAVDAQTAFIGRAGRRQPLRTINGGASWHEIAGNIPTSITDIAAIDALDAQHVLVAGNATNGLGRIIWTSNASAPTPTWSYYNVNDSVLGVQMLDATHWIVVGDNETILRTSDAGAHWTGQMAPNAPTVAITSPTSAHLLDSTTLAIRGTSNDGPGIGVARVELKIEKSGPKYWTGSKWTTTETWLYAVKSAGGDGWDAWERTVSIPDIASAGTLTVWARATDGFGLLSPYAGVTSTGGSPVSATKITLAKSSYVTAYGKSATIAGTLKTSGGSPIAGQTIAITPSSTGSSTKTSADGKFSFTVSPKVKTTYKLVFAAIGPYQSSSAQVAVTTHAKVLTPRVPKYVKHTKSFKAYTYLYPKHTTGSKVMTFYFQKRNSKGKYVTVKRVTAKASKAYSSKSKVVTPSVKLKAGRYRVIAKHSDYGHRATYSARKYFTVH